MKSERCINPFFKCKSKSPENLYGFLTGDKIPICKDCWLKICDKDYQWDE